MLDFKSVFPTHFRKDGKIKECSCIYDYFVGLCNSHFRIREFEGQYYHGHLKTYFNYHFKKYSDFLDKLGIKYEILNDAPRGGRVGNYINIVDIEKATKIKKEFLTWYKKQLKM